MGSGTCNSCEEGCSAYRVSAVNTTRRKTRGQLNRTGIGTNVIESSKSHFWSWIYPYGGIG